MKKLLELIDWLVMAGIVATLILLTYSNLL
jgi:hypothetical protein